MYVIHVRAMMSPDPAGDKEREETCDKNRVQPGSEPEKTMISKNEMLRN